MTSSNKDFIKRLTNNPSLYKYCKVIWKDVWEKDIIMQVKSFILKKINFF